MIELRKLLMGDNPASVLKDLHATGELSELFPELAELDINDRHSHRHKNNFYHSLMVLEQAMELEDGLDIILRTAALLHDIGKPATRKIESSGDASFQNHENVGARMAKEILWAQNYSKLEIDAIFELIANHMRSYGFTEDLWTDSAIRRFANDISSELQLHRLYSIFKADMSTKHTAKRLKIYAKVDALSRRVEAIKIADKLASRRPMLNGNEVMAMFALTPGRKLGELMKFLNSEEGLSLSREEAELRLTLIVEGS